MHLPTPGLFKCGMLYAVLLQEMQLDTASRVDDTKAGDLIPAVWGKRTPDALQMLEPADPALHRSAVSQV